MYKMAVCDIDGTLVNSKGHLSKKTIEVVKKINNGNGIVTLCTGRNVTKTMPIAKKLDIKSVFVCIDGILLYDPVKKSIINDRPISMEKVKKLAQYGFEKNMYIEVSDGYKYYKFFPTKEHIKYDVYNKHDFKGRIKSYFGGIRYIKNIDDFWKIKGNFYQIALAGEKIECDCAKKDIEHMNIEDVEIRDFIMEKYIFMNHIGMGKSRGLKILCDLYNIDINDVIAIGDEMNDIDMLQEAGLGVAMGNAKDEVKKYADEITDTNDNNGAAKILEKYFLS